MPLVNKKMEPNIAPSAAPPTSSPASIHRGCCGGKKDLDFGKKILMTLLGVLMVYVIFYVGTLLRNNIKKYSYIGMADQMERTVMVTGFGKVTGKNDIAVTTIGYSNTDKDVAKAQEDNRKVMDAILADLKKLGIDKNDAESSYSIYPDYNYTDTKGKELKGYQVSSNVTVKVRDLTKVGSVLGLASKYGANNISGLTFTIDDPENLKVQARSKALADAQQKAKNLAQSLGVRLVSIISYNDYEASPNPPIPYFYGNDKGMGGPTMESAPQVASGSNDVAMNVMITYKILP